MNSFSYAFLPDKEARTEFPRILEKISGRLETLTKRRGDPTETVHDIRTLIKLLRAMLWLAKPAMSRASAVAAKRQFQRAAHRLSANRDQAVMLFTLQEIEKDARGSEHRAAQKVTRVFAAIPSVPPPRRTWAKVLSAVQRGIRLMEDGANFPPGRKLVLQRLKKAERQTRRA